MSQRVYSSEELDTVLSPALPAPRSLWVKTDPNPDYAMANLVKLECTVQFGRSALYLLAKRCCSPSFDYTLGDVQAVAYFFSNYSKTFSHKECAYILIHLAKRILSFFSDAIKREKPPLNSQWDFWKLLIEQPPGNWPTTEVEAVALAARFGYQLDEALTDLGMLGGPVGQLEDIAKFQMLARTEAYRGGIVDAAMGYRALREGHAIWNSILDHESKARAQRTVNQCIRVRLALL